MAILSGNTYEMNVYFTDKGLDALYSGGLINKLKRFGVGDSQVNYKKYTDLSYQYNQTNGGDYKNSNGNVVDIKTNKLSALSGRIEKGELINSDKIKKINKNKIDSLILREPDLQTTVNYDLSAYKISDSKKYFNIISEGNNKKPIVLGAKNMWKPGLSVGSFLTYNDTTTERNGYISNEEPVYGSISNGGNTLGYPGVSVTKGSLSKTEVQKFYLFNKSRNVLYFDSIDLSTIKPVSHKINATNISEVNNTEFTKISYDIEWTNLDGETIIDGRLNVKIKTELLDGTKMYLLPFEVIEFEVDYEVVNPGSNVKHYRGQTITNPNKSEGLLDFGLTFISYSDLDNKTEQNKYTENINIIVQTKDSGFDKNTFKGSSDGIAGNESFTISLGG